MAQNSADEQDIKVGAVEGELRYWLAKEAVRQGEGRLNAQSATRTALEARSTALTGWAAVSLLAATGAVFTVQNPDGRIGAALPVSCCLPPLQLAFMPSGGEPGAWWVTIRW